MRSISRNIFVCFALRPVVCLASVQQFVGQQHLLPLWHGRRRAAPFRDRLVVAAPRREGLMPTRPLYDDPQARGTLSGRAPCFFCLRVYSMMSPGLE